MLEYSNIFWRRFCHGTAVYGDAAAVSFFKARYRIEQRSLAAAARSEQADKFAFFDLERYMVESLECAVVLYVLFAYVVYFDKCH